LTDSASASIVRRRGMYSVVVNKKLPRDREEHRLPSVYSASRAKPRASTSKPLDVMDLLRFITHQGKQILLIDLSNCSGAEVEKIFRAVPELVTKRPRGSVLILTDFQGSIV
jgi:predicted nuclease of predicted toxin-antitoxin system